MEKAALQNVYTICRDVPRCVTFYEEVLGLTLKFKDGERWAQLDAGGRNFAVSSVEEAPTHATGTIAVFESTDPEGVAQRVRHAGGAEVATRDMGPHGRVSTFTDVEGNLFQVYSKAQARETASTPGA